MVEKTMSFGVRKISIAILALPFTSYKLGQIKINVLFSSSVKIQMEPAYLTVLLWRLEDSV